MNLSIIIVSWNTADLLEQCLKSVFDYPADKQEVIVVDNASTDESVQMVRQQFPQTTLIANRKNIGFAKANNQAINQSSGRFVLLLNPDTKVKPNALNLLLQFMETHPEAGAAGSMLLNPDESLQPSCYPTPTLSREFWRLFHLDAIWPYGTYKMSGWDTTTPRKVDIVQGAALILRQEALNKVGVLDTDYFIYTEEVDLCYRLLTNGWAIYWVPESRVVHYGGQSTQQVAAEMFLQLYRSKLLFFKKNYGVFSSAIYKIILFTASLARLLLGMFAWLKKPAQRQHYKALAANYRRLIFALPHM